jgi:HSP20 family molecular chaperone IbpA
LRDPADASRTVTPLFDVYEIDTGFVVVADVPGVKPDGLDVTAERDTLTIRARVTGPERPPDHQEFELADYFQTLTLTEDLDASKVSATLKDGVLRITIPKSPGVQPKKIPIRTE